MRAKKKKVLASKAEAELASESGVEVSQAPRESVEEIPHEEEERGTMSAALKPEFRTAAHRRGAGPADRAGGACAGSAFCSLAY